MKVVFLGKVIKETPKNRDLDAAQDIDISKEEVKQMVEIGFSIAEMFAVLWQMIFKKKAKQAKQG